MGKDMLFGGEVQKLMQDNEQANVDEQKTDGERDSYSGRDNSYEAITIKTDYDANITSINNFNIKTEIIEDCDVGNLHSGE